PLRGDEEANPRTIAEGRSGDANRAAQSRSIYVPAAQQDRDSAASRRADRFGEAVRRGDRSRSGLDQEYRSAIAILPNCRTDSRYDRTAPGRPGQYGEGQRPNRHGRDQSIAAD